MLYADEKYSFSEGSIDGDTGIKSVGLAEDIYIDLAKDSLFAQKYIVDKLFLIKDKYIPCDWTLQKRQRLSMANCVQRQQHLEIFLSQHGFAQRYL